MVFSYGPGDQVTANRACLDPLRDLCQPCVSSAQFLSNRLFEAAQSGEAWHQKIAWDEMPGEGSAMTTRKKPAASRKKRSEGKSANVAGPVGTKAKRKISASERWVLISRRVYNQAQKRGFVGGDLSEDLARAAREVDEEYETDVQGLLRLTDPKEMVEQFRGLFVSYGMGQRAIDRLLEINRDALEKLAVTNQRLIDSRAKKSARHAPRMQDAAGEVIRAMQAFSRGLRSNGVNHQLEQPVETVKSLLAGLRTLANPKIEGTASAVGRPGGRSRPRASGAEFVRDAAVKAYSGLTPAELAEAPVAALKGLSREKGRELKAAFNFESIRDMAAWPSVDRAASLVVLADTGADETRGGAASGRRKSRLEAVRAVADGPLQRLDGVTRRQAKVLRDAFNIHTVRDLADNRFFRVARAIVALADTEEHN